MVTPDARFRSRGGSAPPDAPEEGPKILVFGTWGPFSDPGPFRMGREPPEVQNAPEIEPRSLTGTSFFRPSDKPG